MWKLWRLKHVWPIFEQGVSLDQTSGPHKDRVMAPLSSYETAEEKEKTVRAVNHSSLALVHAACCIRGEAQGRCVWATPAADERVSRWTLILQWVTKSGLIGRLEGQDGCVNLDNIRQTYSNKWLRLYAMYIIIFISAWLYNTNLLVYLW